MLQPSLSSCNSCRRACRVRRWSLTFHHLPAPFYAHARLGAARLAARLGNGSGRGVLSRARFGNGTSRREWCQMAKLQNPIYTCGRGRNAIQQLHSLAYRLFLLRRHARRKLLQPLYRPL
jgi:hypothetical protein